MLDQSIFVGAFEGSEAVVAVRDSSYSYSS